MVESVVVYDNENDVIDISEAEVGMLITFLNDAESTRKMSVNDYPTKWVPILFQTQYS